jgi:hypothetical protein
MDDFLAQIVELIRQDEVIISAHGYNELVADNISARDALASVEFAIIVEEYPDYAKGPCVLVLQHDANGRPIHVLWGIASGTRTPAVLVTAYRPDPNRWSKDFLRRAK